VNAVENEPNQWQTYRTRFLVRARQLTEVTAFLDPMGREQRGQAGDYLVESAVGFRRIMSRKFFEDVYVAIQPDSPAPAARAISPALAKDSAATCMAPRIAKRSNFRGENETPSPAPRPLIA
jgi:hypothetical protein